MNQNTKATLTHYCRLLWRYKHYFAAVLLLAVAVGLAVAYSLPRSYRSTATLVMDVPVQKNAIQSTFTEYAGDRIKSISQKVMTTANILAIIKDHDLYLASLGGIGQDELAALFKGDTDIHILKSDLMGQETGESSGIAFTISFSYPDPVTAQQIAAELADSFIEQNDTERSQRAAKVAGFLSAEADKLNSDIQAVDARISAYKQVYKDNLPEQLQANISALDRKEEALMNAEQQIRVIEERLTYLGVELAKAREIVPAASDGANSNLSKTDSLASLRAKYLRLTSLYSPAHPDVIRVKRQIEALAPDAGMNPPAQELRTQLVEARRQLAELRKQAYANNHPDILRLNQQIAGLGKQLAVAPPDPAREPIGHEGSDNPTYLAMEAQYKTSQSELASLREKTVFLKNGIETLRQKVLSAPEVEKGYLELVRERDHSVNKYNQLKEKLLDAKLVQTLEAEQHGQTLTLLEPPTIPTKPDKTARKKVALGGLGAGFVGGFGAVLLAEFLNPKVRGYLALAEISGLMPLVVVPYIESPGEMEAKISIQRQRRKLALQVGAACVLLAVIVIILLAFPAMRGGALLADFL